MDSVARYAHDLVFLIVGYHLIYRDACALLKCRFSRKRQFNYIFLEDAASNISESVYYFGNSLKSFMAYRKIFIGIPKMVKFIDNDNDEDQRFKRICNKFNSENVDLLAFRQQAHHANFPKSAIYFTCIMYIEMLWTIEKRLDDRIVLFCFADYKTSVSRLAVGAFFHAWDAIEECMTVHFVSTRR